MKTMSWDEFIAEVAKSKISSPRLYRTFISVFSEIGRDKTVEECSENLLNQSVKTTGDHLGKIYKLFDSDYPDLKAKIGNVKRQALTEYLLDLYESQKVSGNISDRPQPPTNSQNILTPESISELTTLEFIGRDLPQTLTNQPNNTTAIRDKSLQESLSANLSNHSQGNRDTDIIAYDDIWVGRENIIARLKKNLLGNTRVITLNGITGIGKTALAEKLYLELKNLYIWDRLLRINFDDYVESELTSFKLIAERWLRTCGVMITSEERNDVNKLQAHLINYLANNQCLIIIDSVEWILQGNQENGWSEFLDREWAVFLRKFVSCPSCQSKLVITSQHLPENVSSGYENFWVEEPLSGLIEEEQIDLFRKMGLNIDDEKLTYLKRLGSVYEGHPLVLKHIAGNIKISYDGNILAYWKEYGHEIQKVEQDLDAIKSNKIINGKWQIHQYNRTLYEHVLFRFNRSFERLKQYSYSAYLLICLGSAYLTPSSKEDWLEHLDVEGYTRNEQESAWRILEGENLIERYIEGNEPLYRIHNLVRSVANENRYKLFSEV